MNKNPLRNEVRPSAWKWPRVLPGLWSIQHANDGLRFFHHHQHLGFYFLAEDGSTYVETFLGDTALVNKTEINYEKSVLYLNGLTLGGWASTSGNSCSMTIGSLSIQPDSGTGDILSGVPGTGRPSGKAPQTLMSDCFYLPRQHLERWQTHLLLSSNSGLLKALLLPSVETFPRFRIFFRIFNIIYTVRGLRDTEYTPPSFQNILLIFYVFYRMNLLNINRWNLLRISRQDYSTSFLIF